MLDVTECWRLPNLVNYGGFWATVCTLIIYRGLLSTVVDSRQLPWTFVNVRGLSSTIVDFRQISWTHVKCRGLSSTSVDSRQLPWTVVNLVCPRIKKFRYLLTLKSPLPKVNNKKYHTLGTRNIKMRFSLSSSIVHNLCSHLDWNSFA